VSFSTHIDNPYAIIERAAQGRLAAKVLLCMSVVSFGDLHTNMCMCSHSTDLPAMPTGCSASRVSEWGDGVLLGAALWLFVLYSAVSVVGVGYLLALVFTALWPRQRMALPIMVYSIAILCTRYCQQSEGSWAQQLVSGFMG
jgi:hypothetical protein